MQNWSLVYWVKVSATGLRHVIYSEVISLFISAPGDTRAPLESLTALPCIDRFNLEKRRVLAYLR